MRLQLNSSVGFKLNLPKPLQVERKALIRDVCVDCEGDEGEGRAEFPFSITSLYGRTKSFKIKIRAKSDMLNSQTI